MKAPYNLAVQIYKYNISVLFRGIWLKSNPGKHPLTLRNDQNT